MNKKMKGWMINNEYGYMNVLHDFIKNNIGKIY